MLVKGGKGGGEGGGRGGRGGGGRRGGGREKGVLSPLSKRGDALDVESVDESGGRVKNADELS